MRVRAMARSFTARGKRLNLTELLLASTEHQHFRRRIELRGQQGLKPATTSRSRY